MMNKMTRSRCVVTRCLTLLLSLILMHASSAAAQPAPPPPYGGQAGAPPPDQLPTLLQQADTHLDRGDAAAALAVLEQARQLRPDPGVERGLGLAYAALGRHPEAAHSLESFLRAAATGPAVPAQVSDARRRLDDYQRSLGRLSVRVVLPPIAAAPHLFLNETFVGELPGGATPLPPWLFPGPYQVRVSAPALRVLRTSVDLQPGEVREVTGALNPEGPLPLPQGARPAPPPPVRKRPIYKSVLLWTAVAIGTVVVAGIVVGAIVGGSRHSDHD